MAPTGMSKEGGGHYHPLAKLKSVIMQKNFIS